MADIPKIRFKGFTEPWEQRKLGDLVISHNAGIYISKEDYGTGTNVIGVGNIYDNDIFDGEIYRLGPVNDEKFLLEENDLIYGESSLVPEGIARTVCVGKNGVGSAFAWHTRRVKLDQSVINSHFATLELNYNIDVRKYLISVSTQTALTGMTTEGYFGVTLSLPTVEEQAHISSLFKQLDHLITLHQRKCDDTKELKKYMLQKMFPKNGEKFPEIRFKGFTEAWEQRKVSEYANFFTGNGLNWNDISDDGEQECILYGNLYTDYGMITENIVYRTNTEIKNPVYSEYGDVLIPASDTTPTGLARATSLEKSGVLLGGDINIIRPNEGINGSCLSLALNANRKELIRLIKGTTVRHIHNSEIKDIVICLPKLETEQVRVSSYFKQLDHLITLHQRKCDTLKELKKYMLQNMFPKKG